MHIIFQLTSGLQPNAPKQDFPIMLIHVKSINRNSTEKYRSITLSTASPLATVHCFMVETRIA